MPIKRVVALTAVVTLVLSAATAAAGATGGSVVNGDAGSAAASGASGLHGPARIVRDRFGVNHITASTDRDAFYLQGWVHAEDRLFQMDLSRRQASGRRAELLGPDLVADDIQIRTIGIRRAAERSYEALSSQAKAVLQAYSDGVNAWVASHPLPPEYADVEVTHFEPWTPVDSAAVGKLIAFGLSFDVDIFPTLDYQSYVATGATRGFDGNALWYQDVHRAEPFTHASTIPDATKLPPPVIGDGGASQPVHVDADTVARMRRWSDGVRTLPSFSQLLDPARFDRTGSNEWGVAGSITPTGRPIIANDPHLSLDLPSTFYPIALRAPHLDVIGSGFAGAPTVIVGHNRSIAWGATTNPMDVTDAYSETVVDDPSSPSGLSTVYQGHNEHVIEIPQTFRVNQRGDGTSDDLKVLPPGTPVEGSQLGPVPATTKIVPRRNNGPLILGAFSIQYTGFSATRELDTFLRWDKASNLDDFRQGLKYFDVGSQNWAYADTAGNLAYFTSAEMPLREDLQAGKVTGNPPWFLRDGTGGNEWLPDPHPAPAQAIPYRVLPADEMPHVVNPPAGFFVNANNDPAGTNLDNDALDQHRPGGGIYYLNRGYDGFRAGRITERIYQEVARDGSISFDDMRSIQSDVTLIDAEVLLPHLLDAFDRASGSSDPTLSQLAHDPRVIEAVGRLRTWDKSTPTGIPEGYDASDVDGRLSTPSSDEVANSIGATLYSVWRGQVLMNTVDATLERNSVPTPGGDEALVALRRLLDDFATSGGTGASGLDFFAGARVGATASAADRRDAALLGSLADALDLLAGPTFAPAFGGSTDQDDYRWGRLHRIVFNHPLGGDRDAPPAGGFATQPGLEGIATDGGFSTVDAASHSATGDTPDGFMFGGGPVRRYVGEATPLGIHAVSSVPGGASGLVGSPWYVNLLGPWLTDEAFPQELSPDLYRRDAAEVQHFGAGNRCRVIRIVIKLPAVGRVVIRVRVCRGDGDPSSAA